MEILGVRSGLGKNTHKYCERLGIFVIKIRVSKKVKILLDVSI